VSCSRTCALCILRHSAGSGSCAAEGAAGIDCAASDENCLLGVDTVEASSEDALIEAWQTSVPESWGRLRVLFDCGESDAVETFDGVSVTSTSDDAFSGFSLATLDGGVDLLKATEAS